MEILCKLTSQDRRTFGGFQWELGEWAPELSGKGKLCGPGYYHCYVHPLLACFLNRMHADIKDPRGFLIEAGGSSLDDSGLKRGYTRMRLTEEFPLPEITPAQRVAFGLLCAMEVCTAQEFTAFAGNWLSGKNRSARAAAKMVERTKMLSSQAWAKRAALEVVVIQADEADEADEAAAAAEAAKASAWAAEAAAWAAAAARAGEAAMWARERSHGGSAAADEELQRASGLAAERSAVARASLKSSAPDFIALAHRALVY